MNTNEFICKIKSGLTAHGYAVGKSLITNHKKTRTALICSEFIQLNKLSKNQLNQKCEFIGELEAGTIMFMFTDKVFYNFRSVPYAMDTVGIAAHYRLTEQLVNEITDMIIGYFK